MKTAGILASAALTALAISFAPQPARIPLLLAAGWLIAQIAILVHTWKHPLHGHAINWTVAGLAVLTVVGAYAASAQASTLPLGISDDQASLEQRNQWCGEIGCKTERFVVYVGQPGVAARIRASHAAGRHVILTVGGLGTRTRRPRFTRAMRYIRTLPRAERYTISNEPDLDGVKPCTYRKGWMKARRVLGRRLLWGDTSPHRGVRFTQAAAKCGPLPKHLEFATHPYQPDDPLRITAAYAGTLDTCLGCLSRARRTLKALGVTVTWWLTEFGYAAQRSTEDGLELKGLQDHEAAWLWPRALKQARRVHAKVLVVYTAQGPSWDTRPGVQAWAAIRAHV